MKKVIAMILVSLLMASGLALAEGKLAWYGPYSSPYVEEVKGYVEQFMADTGCDVRILIGSQNDQMTQDNNLRALVGDGCMYIASYPGSDGAAGLYDELGTYGVSVVGYGATTATEAEAFCVATDVYAAAYAACEAAIEAIGGEGGIVSVLGMVNDTNTLKRKQAVEDCIAAHEGVELVQNVVDIKSIDQGVEKVSTALSANADKIDAIVCTHTASSSATAQVLDDYYARNPEADKIIMIGIDTQDDVMKGIENGIVYGTIAQNTFAHGYVPMMILKYLSEGWQKVQGKYFIDSGYILVTKDNIETYKDERIDLTNRICDNLTVEYLTKD